MPLLKTDQHRCDSSCRCCAASPCLDGPQSTGATPLATSLGNLLSWNRVVSVRKRSTFFPGEKFQV